MSLFKAMSTSIVRYVVAYFITFKKTGEAIEVLLVCGSKIPKGSIPPLFQMRSPCLVVRTGTQ
jgi:hypothetical protein